MKSILELIPFKKPKDPPRKTELRNPPGHPVEWRATIINLPSDLPKDSKLRRGQQTTVTSRTWFDAREQACRLLGCEPGHLDVREIEP